MIHLPDQIQDLGYILIIAAVVTLIFKRLRQPVVLGYLVAGFLLGPHVTFLPTIADPEGVKVWAEIGVIFLLFGLGLEFSFKKLAAVGKTASITAGVEVIVMLGLGYLAGQVMGWSKMDSIFLGGILSISSTTIIVRAFDELGLKGRRFVSIVFGVLIVEDLIAILLLALLSTIAATQTVAGGTLALAGLKLGFSLILWFLVGIYLVPVFLRKIHGYLNDETTLVVSIGLCLLLVIIATKAGFSPALGAFVMGSIIAETRDGKRIEHLLMPVKDLFAAIFFVSVGMLIDPRVLHEYGWVIAGITLLTIVGKFFSSAIGALLAGQALRHSVQAGMSLAQIGEFSFIIATLGVTLKVTSDFLYPVAVAVSAITTFTTPYLIREADRFAGLLERKLPPTLLARLEGYQSAFHDRGPPGSAIGLLWDAYGVKVALNMVVIVAVTLAGTRLLLPAIDARFGEQGWTTMAAGALALVACAPFLWAIVFGGPAKQALANAESLARLKGLQTGATLVRWMIGAALVLFVVSQFATTRATSGVAILLVFLVGAFFSRFAEPVYSAVEERFLANLDDKEREELSRAPARAPLAPWNAALAELVLSPDSDLAGKSLMDSALKERFGVTIALIERGHRRVLAPGRNDLLLPGDRLHLIGTEDQIVAARPVIEQTGGPVPLADLNFGLEAVRLPPQSRFLNKPIRDSGLREAINGLIVGIEREGKRILNPDSATTLSAGDLIWVVGDKERIKTL